MLADGNAVAGVEGAEVEEFTVAVKLTGMQRKGMGLVVATVANPRIAAERTAQVDPGMRVAEAAVVGGAGGQLLAAAVVALA